jgi:hypothetical protein
MRGNKSLKRYIAEYTVIDGMHKHINWLLITADNDNDARSMADSLSHDPDAASDEGSHQHPWSFGDGSTASRLKLVRKITDAQFSVIRDVMGLMIYQT